MADMIAAHSLDALIAAEAMRAGTATGWITGWPVTAEAVTLIIPGAARRMFIQHFNHLPLARRLAHDTEVLWGEAGALGLAAEAVRKARSGKARVGVIGRTSGCTGWDAIRDVRGDRHEPGLYTGSTCEVG